MILVKWSTKNGDPKNDDDEDQRSDAGFVGADDEALKHGCTQHETHEKMKKKRYQYENEMRWWFGKKAGGRGERETYRRGWNELKRESVKEWKESVEEKSFALKTLTFDWPKRSIQRIDNDTSNISFSDALFLSDECRKEDEERWESRVKRGPRSIRPEQMISFVKKND